MYPAGEVDITARHVRVGDCSIRVIESGPSGGRPILLVHGWGGCVYTYAEMIPALAGAGYRVAAFDLPGHGLSDKPSDEGRYTTRALSDVLLGVASAIGMDRFTFVGHSMGGSLGLHLAAEGDTHITRLVLVNSIGIGRVPLRALVKLLSPRILDRITPALLTRTVIHAILRAAFGTFARPTDRDIDEYWAPSQYDGLAWACRACIHKTTWRQLSATQLRSLRLPTLVITGRRDLLVRRGSPRARLIPGARLVTVPDGGHLVLQECAEKTNAQILAFLRETR